MGGWGWGKHDGDIAGVCQVGMEAFTISCGEGSYDDKVTKRLFITGGIYNLLWVRVGGGGGSMMVYARWAWRPLWWWRGDGGHSNSSINKGMTEIWNTWVHGYN